MSKSKKKKEKVIWYDDNSTISDMSNVGRNGKKPQTPSKNTTSNLRAVRLVSTFKDKWNTYWHTVKLMVFPMLVALAIIAILYLITLWIGNSAM